MSENSTFKLHIHAAERDYFNGDCRSLVVPLSEGQYGILAHHSNMVAAIVPGDIKIVDADGNVIEALVSAGMIKVENNEVLMLVNFALTEDELIEMEARREKDRIQEEELAKRQTGEFMDAEAFLRRTIYKLKNSKDIKY